MTNPTPPEITPQNQGRFEAAIRAFDEANAQDPNRERVGEREEPREQLYAQWLTQWVLRLCPQASEPLRLAARCQHLCRWMIPRDSFPMTRAGYLQWRTGLRKFHAQKAGEILRQTGYPDQTVARVEHLVLKAGFPQDPESRVIEDALCLVFLEHQFEDLARKTTEDKLINALQKTWRKMTPQAQQLALRLPYPPALKTVLERALEP